MPAAVLEPANSSLRNDSITVSNAQATCDAGLAQQRLQAREHFAHGADSRPATAAARRRPTEQVGAVDQCTCIGAQATASSWPGMAVTVSGR
jgi:hypothetical protein